MLKEYYNETVKKELLDEFKYSSSMEIPKIDKIVINMGLGSLAVENSKIIDDAIEELTVISGQKPQITTAKKSIAGFKVREEMPLGVKVTLRGSNMYNFLEKLISISLPRVRDFQGVNPKAFDGRGNYTIGITEQLIFPEIDFDKVKKVKGMDITIVTTAQNNEEAKSLLEKMGIPFKGKKGDK
ncbi:MAG: 50S ribosomal protein L5 [Mycoplasmatales bacterium]